MQKNKIKYYRNRNKKLYKTKSPYISIGLSLILVISLPHFLKIDFIKKIKNVIDINKLAFLLVSKDLNNIYLYITCIGISLIFLSPLLKNKYGKRNTLIITTLFLLLGMSFFLIFSLINSKAFQSFFIIFEVLFISILVFDCIKIGENILAWIAPKGTRSVDSSKVSTVWTIVWAIFLVVLSVIGGKIIGK